MIKMSRRVLARYGADQLLAGVPAAKLGRQLAAVLNEQNMLAQAELLADDINFELERRKELAVGRVTSARALDAKTVTEIEQAIKRATGAKHIAVDTQVDKSLIGGVRIETAQRVWDESLKHKLANLRGVA